MTKRNPKTHRPNFWGYARSFLHSYIAKERQLSRESADAYRISLECLIGYAENVLGIHRCDMTFDIFEYSCLKGWLKWMIGVKEYSPKTIELRLTSVRTFLRYCSTEDIALMDLYTGAQLLKGPKKKKQPIDYLSEPAIKAVLEAFDGSTTKSRRNRAMLILLYDSAVRVSELADICLCDLSLAEPARIVVTGKGEKTRTIPIMAKTADHMRVYLDEFHPGWEKTRTIHPFFYSYHGGIPTKLSTDTIDSILKKAASIALEHCAEVPANIHCHMMRKTRAMDLYQQGVPLAIIMQLLGHESMSTTTGFYAFATSSMMFKAMSSASSPEISEQPAEWLEKRKLDALYSLR